MPETSNVFSLSTQSRRGEWAHGKALAHGSYRAVASIRRGINLSAAVDLEGRLDGEARKVAVATFSIGGRLAAGLSLQAAFPIDLFKEAGMVARFQAQLEVAAWIAAEIGLDIGALREMLGTRASKSWQSLLDVFLGELEIRAGVWGKASFSAQIFAEAAVVGHLIPLDGTPPGFTVSFEADAGVEWGAGMVFLVNLSFKDGDAARFLDRLADQLATLLEEQVLKLADHERDSAKTGVMLSKFLLPFTFRLVLNAGLQLAITQRDHRQEAVSRMVARTFLGEAQEFVAQTVVRLALKQLAKFGQANADRTPGISEEALAEGSILMQSIHRSIVQMLAENESNWPALLTSTLDGAVKLTELKLFNAAATSRIRQVIALTWAGGMIFSSIVMWTTKSEQGEHLLQLDSQMPLPEADGLKRLLLDELASGPNVSVEALVRYMSDKAVGYLEDTNAVEPDILRVLRWLSTVVTGGDNISSLLHSLFDDGMLTRPDTLRELRTRLLTSIAPIIDTEVIAPLCNRVIAADPGNADVIQQIVKPSLRAVARILPAIEQVGNSDDRATVVREQISVVALQLVSRMVVLATDVLLEKGLQDAHQFIGEMSRQANHPPKIIADVNAVSPIQFDTQSLSAIFALLADVIQHWNERVRPQVFKSVREIVSLGLLTGQEDFDHVWLATQSPGPLQGNELMALSTQMVESSWGVFGYVLEHMWKILKEAFKAFGRGVAAVVKEALRIIMKAIQAAVDQFIRGAAELFAIVRRLMEEVEALVGEILAGIEAITRCLLDLMDETRSFIRDSGWNLVRDALHANPIYHILLGPLKETAEAGIRELFNVWLAGIDALLTLATGPLKIVNEMAGWLHDELLNLHTMNRDQLINNLRARALEGINDLTVPLRYSIVTPDLPWPFPKTPDFIIDLGVITLPGASLAYQAVDFVLGTPQVNDIVNRSVSNAQQKAAKQAEANGLEAQRLANDQEKQRLQATVNNLTTGQPLSISFEAPKPEQVAIGGVTLRIKLTGANRTFIEPTLNLPTRVRILINGLEYPYRVDEWQEVGNDLHFALDLSIRKTNPANISPTGPPVALALGLSPRAHVIPSDLESERDSSVRRPHFHLRRRTEVDIDETRPEGDVKRYAVISPWSSPGATILASAAVSEGQPGKELEAGLNIVQVVVVEGKEQGQSLEAMHSFYLQRPEEQEGWSWCSKCHALFRSNHNRQTVCAAGDSHQEGAAFTYVLSIAAPSVEGQLGWRQCLQCSALFFSDYAGSRNSFCPDGGRPHAPSDINYALVVNRSDIADLQPNWKWCKNCETLFFDEPGGAQGSICPRRGPNGSLQPHSEEGSGNYSLKKLPRKAEEEEKKEKEDIAGRLMIGDFSQGPPLEIKYKENWGQYPDLEGWHDAEDLQLVGDFLRLGYDQVLFLNRDPQRQGGRVMIADFSQGVRLHTRYWETWGQHAELDGWHDNGDVLLAGDFMKLGHDQVLFINRDPQRQGGRVMIADFSQGPPVRIKYREDWGQYPDLEGWHDAEDLQLAGDFLRLGYDQVLFLNRDPQRQGGRVMIADFSQGVRLHTRYWETWGQHAELDGWHDNGDVLLAGDFMKLGHDQVLFINRDPQRQGGRVMIADFSQGPPVRIKYREDWGQYPDLEGWHDAEDLQLAGDFLRLGYDQVLFLNRDPQRQGGRVMIADFSQGARLHTRYWETWGQHAELDGWHDPNDLQLVGDYRRSGYNHVLFINRPA